MSLENWGNQPQQQQAPKWLFESAWANMDKALWAAHEWAKSWFNRLTNFFSSSMDKLSKWIVDWANWLAQTAKDAYKSTTETLASAWDSAAKWVIDWWKSLGNSINKWEDVAFENVLSAYHSSVKAGREVSNLVYKAIDSTNQLAQGLSVAVKEWVITIREEWWKLYAKTTDWAEYALQVTTDKWNKVLSYVDWKVQYVSDAALNTRDTAHAVARVLDEKLWVSASLRSARDWVVNTARSVKDWAVNVAQWVANKVWEWYNSVATNVSDKYNSIANSVEGFQNEVQVAKANIAEERAVAANADKPKAPAPRAEKSI